MQSLLRKIDLQLLLAKGYTLVIGGYADSGKTTLIQDLIPYSKGIVSLSVICHKIAQELEPDRRRVNTKNPIERARMINFIENGLMVHIGRKRMVSAAMETFTPGSIIETVGGVELRYFTECLESKGIQDILLLNVRSTAEKPDVDLRILLPSDLYYSWENLTSDQVAALHPKQVLDKQFPR